MRQMIALSLLIIAIFGVTNDLCHCKEVQFIFGDSLSDVGNNNRLSKSLAKANLPWYGIDYDTGLPNGRFTNGRTVADIIGDKMGLPRPPAFLDPSLTEDVILDNGVNYASGGGGILNETGGLFIQKFSLYKQIELFIGTRRLIVAHIGEKEANKFFENSRYVVALGSNDFINNYLMPVYGDSWKYSQEDFIKYLMETLEAQLKILHSLGARKLMVFGLGPMGCIPLQRVLSISSSGACQEKTNKIALIFNQAGTKLMNQLSTSLPNASYTFGDAYDVVNNVITNPSKYGKQISSFINTNLGGDFLRNGKLVYLEIRFNNGFTNADSPCCSFGRIRPALTCVPASTLCKDRSKYLFWDEYHPSDKANELIANEIIQKLGFVRGSDTPSFPSPGPAVAPSSSK